MRVGTGLAVLLAGIVMASGAFGEERAGDASRPREPLLLNADRAPPGAPSEAAGATAPQDDSTTAEAASAEEPAGEHVSEDADLGAASAAAHVADKHKGKSAKAPPKTETGDKSETPAAVAGENGEKSEAAAEDAAMKEAEKVTAEHEKKADETAKDAPRASLEPTLAISVDLSAQRLTVAENGETLYTWPISSGRSGYETPTGSFKPVWMTKMWYSRQYDYAPMPNAIFFHGGAAIHATYATGALGRPASHGCVRLAPANASKLFKLVSSHGKERTEIVVHGTPNFDREVAGGGSRSGRRYYDGYYGYGYGTGYYYGNYGYQPSYRNRYSRYDGSYGQRQRRAYSYDGRAPRYAPRGLFSSNGYGY